MEEEEMEEEEMEEEEMEEEIEVEGGGRKWTLVYQGCTRHPIQSL